MSNSDVSLSVLSTAPLVDFCSASPGFACMLARRYISIATRTISSWLYDSPSMADEVTRAVSIFLASMSNALSHISQYTLSGSTHSIATGPCVTACTGAVVAVAFG